MDDILVPNKMFTESWNIKTDTYIEILTNSHKFFATKRIKNVVKNKLPLLPIIL